MNITLNNIDQLAWQKMDALIPAIVQHAKTGEVLMQGYMNQAAVAQTLTSQKVTFYSRAKQRLWQKGESSGNVLELVTLSTDCDQDSILVQALPQGPTCHLGTNSCFAAQQTPELSFINQLEQVIAERKNADASSSYTASLYAEGIRKIAQKVGEEGVEVALAAVAQEDAELLGESADLLFHLLVLLQARNLSLGQVIDVLNQRHNIAKSAK